MANDQSSDQELQLKKRARRRLVGAVALVLLMVTLLPIVLDNHTNEPLQPEIAISIPGKDSDEFASKIIPVPSANTAAPAAAGNAATPPTPEPTPPAASPTEPVATPATEKLPSEPPQATENPQTVSAATAKKSYAVQIGLFSDAVKVKQLQSKINALGIETKALKEGQKVRLRAGPYPSKEEALQVIEQLKAAGYQALLVKL